MKEIIKVILIFLAITLFVSGFLLYRSYIILKGTQTTYLNVNKEKEFDNSKKSQKDTPKQTSTTPPFQETSSKAKITLFSDTVKQGETLLIEVVGDVKQISLEGKKIPFSKIKDKNIAVIGIDTRENTGLKKITYQTSMGKKEITFEIINKDYPITKIIIPEKLAEQGVTSGDLAESIASKDTITLSEILSNKTENYQFSDKFVYPLDQWIDVGWFGNIRQDQYGAIRHLGVDLDGKTGDPVYATNSGTVEYAGLLQNYGNSVVINHGLGIFSLYLHMSKTVVETGEKVMAGEKIGEVGNTGDYTLEPHLHFSIKVDGESVNPKDFIDTLNEILEN